MTARRAAAILLAALAAGCGRGEPDEVRVSAASSLTDVLKTIAADFEQSTGAKVKLNLASSSVLAKQIVEGAPCDVFLSADREWADFVEMEGMVEPGTRRDLLTNTLVVVTWLGLSGRPGVDAEEPGWENWEAPLLDSRNRIALADPNHVPAGRYAKATLQARKRWEAIAGKVIPCESVRAALALVERGEADAGIVYATDAQASKADLATTPLPTVPGVDIRYPVLGVTGLGAGGRAFLDFLGKERALDAFRRAGFGVPSPPK